jgi:hypothetical protein
MPGGSRIGGYADPESGVSDIEADASSVIVGKLTVSIRIVRIVA